MVLQIVIIVVVVLLVLIAALLVYAATRPDSFNIQRTASIKAAPERIYPLISDFHNWASWSPFEKYDPAMKKTHSGAANGSGAVYEWEGNSRAGKGRMEITETSAPSRVTIKLDFIKPFEGHNFADFTLKAKNDTTDVTWAMSGPNTYMLKVMGIFMSMDSMLGKEFDAGLANLKSIAEK